MKQKMKYEMKILAMKKLKHFLYYLAQSKQAFIFNAFAPLDESIPIIFSHNILTISPVMIEYK